MSTTPKGVALARMSRREVLGTLGAAAGALTIPWGSVPAAERRSGPPPIFSDEWPIGYEAVPVHVGAFGKPEDATEAFRPIDARARVLVAQLAQGYNYLGQPSDFVTRYDVTAYGEGLKDLFEHASRAETTRAGYRTSRGIRDDRDRHFDDQMRASAELQHQHEDEIGVIANTIDSNAKAVAALNTEVAKQRDRLLALQDTFDEACRQFSQRGCDLGGIVHAVSAFVGIVTAVYTGGASIVATVGEGLQTVRSAMGAVANAADVSALVADVRRGYDAAVNVVGHVRSDWDSIQSGWQQYRELVATAPDTAKVTIDESALRAQLDRFMSQVDGSPVAPDLKNAFKDSARIYFNLVQTRNSKLLENDALILRKGALRSQIELRKAEQVQLASLKATNADPDADAYLQMLDSMSAALLEQLRLLVWQEARALWLWSLEAPPSLARLDGREFGSVEMAHGLIAAAFRTRLAQAPGNAEPFANRRVVFRLDAASAAAFRSSGRISLDVRREHFPRSWYAIYVTKVEMRLPGAAEFSGTVTHSGRAYFESEDRPMERQVFSTRPRTSFVTNEGLADLGAQEGKYVGLSPFAIWLLALDSTDVLSNVSVIECVFQGWHRTRQL